MKLLAMLSLLFFIPLMAQAEKPSPKEINKVINFYDKGFTQGAILVDMKLCADVHKSGEAKNNCIGELAGNNLTAGEEAFVWVNLLVPTPEDGAKQKLLLQFNHDNLTRTVRQKRVGGSIRYRTWTKIKLDRPGTWSVKALHDNGSKVFELGQLPIKVIDSANPAQPKKSAN